MATEIQKIIAEGKALAFRGAGDEEILQYVRPRLVHSMRNREKPPMIVNGVLLDIIHGRK